MKDSGHTYFEVDSTNADIPRRGQRIAVLAGDAPVRNEENGTTSYSMRFPILIMSDLVSEPEGVAEKVAELLNKNAHMFFKSAQTRHEARDPAITDLLEALRPFAKAGLLFPEKAPNGVDMLIYGPAARDEYSLGGDDLRKAREVFEKHGGTHETLSTTQNDEHAGQHQAEDANQ